MACAIVAIANAVGISIVSSRNTGQQAGLKSAAVTEATLLLASSLLEPSLSRSDHCPGSMSSVVADPKAGHQPLTEAAYVNPPTMQHRLCLALGGHRHTPSSRAAPSAGRMWVLAQEFCTGPAPSSRSTQWAVTPDLCLYGDPEERKARAGRC